MKTELLKSRKQIRIYLAPGNTEDLKKLVAATELPETTICNAVIAAGLTALRKQGGAMTLPLRFRVDDSPKA